jgi:hypothetical protein
MARRIAPDYHSALQPELDAPPLQRFEIGSSVAFMHDLESGPLPSEYASCDLLYVEPPWREGYEEFNARAGVVGRSYRHLMRSIGVAIYASKAPSVVIAGNAIGLLPPPSSVMSSTLHTYRVTVLLYGLSPPTCVKPSNESLIRALLQRYDRVGDFCCGYGLTARLALEAGKSFVVSDVNPRCIGYIAKQLTT